MKILSIETSCDETAVSVVEARGGLENPSFVVLGNALFSQIDIHIEYGGVFPMLAKREHAKKLPVLLKKTLEDAGLYKTSDETVDTNWQEIEQILIKEEGLYDEFRKFFEHTQKPDVDAIAVTAGPGLVPALWVGISFATALGKLWNLPVVPANHMEGHIASVLLHNTNTIEFPALALLISGGHTELVEIPQWGEYKIIGETVDDAVGEAFDKVARMMKLPYPGGPQISKLAECARENALPQNAKLPRPMLHSGNLNFSFAGLKTAVLYYIRDHFTNTVLDQDSKTDIAREFEDAVVDVLYHKTLRALEENGAKTLVIAGGVIANKKVRATFAELEKKMDITVRVPDISLTGDNAIMIACATYIQILLKPELLSESHKIVANGNLKL